MPGDRLDLVARNEIADGLTLGLSLAEIARRLDRPTSTVSREVARNGGRHAYRPDHAQQATHRRARRPRVPNRPPAADQPGVNRPRVAGPRLDAVRRYEEEFAELMVGTGFPRMAARVLACLFTTDAESLSARDLVIRLDVSPASISKAIGYLESLQLVTRHRNPGERRERYAVDEDVWYRAWTRRAESFTQWADTAGRGAQLFGPDTPGGARLTLMHDFLDHVAHEVSRLTDSWLTRLTQG